MVYYELVSTVPPLSYSLVQQSSYKFTAPTFLANVQYTPSGDEFIGFKRYDEANVVIFKMNAKTYAFKESENAIDICLDKRRF